MYSILVNSTDKYSDCWEPFFYLFKKNWENVNADIYLNCENKSFSFDDLPIKFIRNKVTDSWSECLINAVENIKSPVILYLQDDYFLNARVDNALITEFVNLMMENREIKHIGLTKFGSPASPVEYPADNRLTYVKKKTKYRISLQAGLWDKACLRSYIMTDENAWMLEIFGSMRASKRNDLFLTISGAYYKNTGVIDYINTGIIKGKWHTEIPKFFRQEGLDLDFSKRGIIDPHKNKFINKFQTLKKLLSKPYKIKYMLP
ncbi:MAG: hypothetical protein H7Z13_00945 [Ferruginibacter sp.]|nr:hypothetical protein [Ferruginibacter sp.]